MHSVDKEPLSLLIPSLSAGGTEKVFARLATEFSKRGYRVHIVAGSATGPMAARLPSDVRVFDLGSPHVYGFAWGLISYLKRERPLAMLSALDNANLALIWARRLAGVTTRVVISARSTMSLLAEASEDRIRGKVTPYLARRFYRFADEIIAVSHGVAADLANVGGIPLSRIRVVYNPVIQEEIDSASTVTDHTVPGGDHLRTVLAVGRLAPEKDFSTLIRAMSIVQRSHPSQLVILGEGADRRKLLALADSLGLSTRVSMPGYVDNPYQYYPRASVFVLSSLVEGFPNALVEALAYGLPVVATNCRSGPDEILDGGRYGELVPVRDYQKMARAIVTALESPSNREERRLYCRKFSLEAAVAGYLDAMVGDAAPTKGRFPNGRMRRTTRMRRKTTT